MVTGTTNVGATPCCGLITRSWECLPDVLSETGYTHVPGGDYAPDFAEEADLLKVGTCPDCGRPFRTWIRREAKAKMATEGPRFREFRYDFRRALLAYSDGPTYQRQLEADLVEAKKEN